MSTREEFLDEANDRDEVERSPFFSLEEIRRMVERSEPFYPEFTFLLEQHYAPASRAGGKAPAVV